MKNILSIILIIGCLLTLFSCNNEPEPEPDTNTLSEYHKVQFIPVYNEELIGFRKKFLPDYLIIKNVYIGRDGVFKFLDGESFTFEMPSEIYSFIHESLATKENKPYQIAGNIFYCKTTLNGSDGMVAIEINK